MSCFTLIVILLSLQSFVTECQSIFPVDLGDGYQPIILTLNNGNFLINWAAHSSALLFNANGSLINEIAIGNNTQPQFMALLADNTFVYAWTDYLNGFLQVFAQRFNENGTLYGDQITVDSGNLTNLNQLVSSVTALNTGGFVIVWDGENNDEGRGVGWTVAQSYAQVFNSDNTPRGQQFVVYKGTANSHQVFPITLSLGNEGFGIFWNEINSNMTLTRIFGQLYHSNGAKIGNSFIIDDTTITQFGQAAVLLGSGDIVVTWQGLNASNNKFYIYARILGSNGKPKGDTFLVQTNGNDSMGVLPPAVTVLTTGRFVISWYSGNPYQLYFQMYRSNGNPYQSPVLVNPSNMTEADNRWPSITGMKDGGFVIAWTYCQPQSVDCQIYAQRYDLNGNLAPFVQDKVNNLEEYEFDEI